MLSQVGLGDPRGASQLADNPGPLGLWALFPVLTDITDTQAPFGVAGSDRVILVYLG